jgi:hypothetical protein
MGRYIYIQNGKKMVKLGSGEVYNESLSFDLMDIRVSTNKIKDFTNQSKDTSLICRGGNVMRI